MNKQLLRDMTMSSYYAHRLHSSVPVAASLFSDESRKTAGRAGRHIVVYQCACGQESQWPPLPEIMIKIAIIIDFPSIWFINLKFVRCKK
jgi:hypothetical protein